MLKPIIDYDLSINRDNDIWKSYVFEWQLIYLLFWIGWNKFYVFIANYFYSSFISYTYHLLFPCLYILKHYLTHSCLQYRIYIIDFPISDSRRGHRFLSLQFAIQIQKTCLSFEQKCRSFISTKVNAWLYTLMKIH